MAKTTRKKTDHYCGIGGQAVLEGIMMKNKDAYSVAVRKPNGKIEIKVDEYISKGAGSKWKQLPFIRGVFNFLDSMILGMKCLNYSASFYEEPDEEDTALDKVGEKIFEEKSEDAFMVGTLIISLVIAIGLFMVLPYYLAQLLSKVVANETLLALFEGLIRLFIFLLYVTSISLMKDIRRLYQYHGAEHKCINCIEKGKVLTVENVRRSSRLHKRCGTSFLLFVMFVSIILFFFIRVDNPVLRVVIRILLIPVIAGISYELIRLAGKSNNVLVRLISAPGLGLQKLTTKEPDDDMIVVAIAAIEAVFDWKEYFRTEFHFDVDEGMLIEEREFDLSEEIEHSEASGGAEETKEPAEADMDADVDVDVEAEADAQENAEMQQDSETNEAVDHVSEIQEEYYPGARNEIETEAEVGIIAESEAEVEAQAEESAHAAKE